MQSSVKIVACLLRVRSVIFHFSTRTFLSELQPAQTVATPTEVIQGQYTIWHDSKVLQFVTSWPNPMSVIFRQCERMTSFKSGHPFPKAARPMSPTFCTTRNIWNNLQGFIVMRIYSTCEGRKYSKVFEQVTEVYHSIMKIRPLHTWQTLTSRWISKGHPWAMLDNPTSPTRWHPLTFSSRNWWHPWLIAINASSPILLSQDPTTKISTKRTYHN